MASPQLGSGLDVFTEFSLRFREFVLTTYHNLPNTLFVASLLLGAIQGNIAMVWVAVGMALNALITASYQEILGLIFEDWDQVRQPLSQACTFIQDYDSSSPDGTAVVAPSLWFSGSTFFTVYVLYNAIQVAIRPAAKNADKQKVSVRMAFTLSVIMLSIFFMLLILLRGLTGCETWLGSILGVLVGSGTAIGYWHLLDICHSGVTPDILNVTAATAPPSTGSETPVICTA